MELFSSKPLSLPEIKALNSLGFDLAKAYTNGSSGLIIPISAHLKCDSEPSRIEGLGGNQTRYFNLTDSEGLLLITLKMEFIYSPYGDWEKFSFVLWNDNIDFYLSTQVKPKAMDNTGLKNQSGNKNWEKLDDVLASNFKPQISDNRYSHFRERPSESHESVKNYSPVKFENR